MNRHERRLAAKQQKQQKFTPEQAFKLALELHQQQRFEEAELVYQKLLDIQAQHPDALHYLGVLLHQTGRSEQAIAHIQQALTLVPDYVDAWNNLGNILNENGDNQGAAEAYRRVLTLSPNHAGVHNNLGIALRHLEAYEESISALKKALMLSPNNPDTLQNLGNSYREHGDYSLAIDVYRESLALKPTQKTLYERLWTLLLVMNQQDAARDVLQQWIAVDPDNHVAQHHFFAHTNQMPERASEGYIQETFDSFAASFDAVLTRLDYCAPRLVGQAVAVLYPEPNAQFCVLDAGCGTGLSGIALRPYAHKLIGVDLSQGMLNKARNRELYDELIQADLVKYLSSYRKVFDVIISADTLVYFGALEAFLHAARLALTTTGALIFTVEKHDGDDGFYLNFHGRYAHTPCYINNALLNAGFEVRAMETVILRKEAGKPVVGILVTAILQDLAS